MTESLAPPRVVVGVDGSPESKQALAWADHLARMLHARLDAVIAWKYPAGYDVAPGARALRWDPAAAADSVLWDAVHEVLGTAAPEDMRLAVTRGHPAEVLLAESRGALMVVLGSRGRGAVAGMVLGSTGRAVLERAECAVLISHGWDGPPITAG